MSKQDAAAAPFYLITPPKTNNNNNENKEGTVNEYEIVMFNLAAFGQNEWPHQYLEEECLRCGFNGSQRLFAGRLTVFRVDN